MLTVVEQEQDWCGNQTQDNASWREEENRPTTADVAGREKQPGELVGVSVWKKADGSTRDEHKLPVSKPLSRCH